MTNHTDGLDAAGVAELAQQLVNAFSIYTIEDDDGIRLSTGGHTVAHYGEHSSEGMALLKLEAHCRELRSALASPTPSVAARNSEALRCLEELANTPLGISLEEWCRLSGPIYKALAADGAKS